MGREGLWGQMTISAGRDQEVFLEEEGTGSCQGLALTLSGLAQPCQEEITLMGTSRVQNSEQRIHKLRNNSS